MVASDDHTRSRARVDVSGTTPRRFECTEDGASKFWEVVVDGASLTTRWGRLGTSGQVKTKAFADASVAVGEMQKLVREKTRKGYVEVDASAHADVVAVVPAPADVAVGAPAPAPATDASERAATATTTVRAGAGSRPSSRGPAETGDARNAPMPAREPENAPDPVPDARRLVWTGEPVIVQVRPRAHHLPRVVPIDAHDVGLLYLTRLPVEELQRRGWTGTAEMLVSRRLRGAFTAWPPGIDEPLDQLRRDFGNSMPPEVLQEPDQGFIIPLSEPIVGRFDAPGAVQRPDGAGGPHLPPRIREAVQAALGGRTKGRLIVHTRLDDGSTLVVAIQSAWREDEWGRHQHVQGGLQVLRATADGAVTIVSSADSLPIRLERLVARGDDGAWLVGSGDDGACAVPWSADGTLGEPWRVPFHRAMPGARTLQRWGKSGLVVATVTGPELVLLLTDGRHTTRIEGAVASEGFVTGHPPSLAVSPDGATIVAVLHTVDGLWLARAEVTAEASSATSDPWSAERRVAAERAARAPAPRPQRLPGRPVEPATKDGPLVRHARDRVLGQIRVRHLARAIGALYYEGASFFSGDDRVGQFLDHDGCGNHVAVAWDATGVAAIGFDHDVPRRRDAEDTWKKHFAPPPAELEPLLARAFELSERLATETLWISAGPEPRWASREDGNGGMLTAYTMTPDAVFFGDALQQTWLERLSLDEAHARLAIRLASASARGPVTLTARDVAILTRPPSESRGEGAHADLAAEALAMAGVRWERGR